MNPKVEYRIWSPGYDKAILPLVLSTGWLSDENFYRDKFKMYPELEPEGIRLAVANRQVVGHVLGRPITYFAEGIPQKFGRVEWMIVAPQVRRQGVGQQLMEHLIGYFVQIGCRGIILSTNSIPGFNLYRKVGFRQITTGIHTFLHPSEDDSKYTWMETNLSVLQTLHELHKQWARQTFPVPWGAEDLHQFNLSQYRMLRLDNQIVGYTKWRKPSEGFPHSQILDPVAPNEDPMAIIESVRSSISTSIK